MLVTTGVEEVAVVTVIVAASLKAVLVVKLMLMSLWIQSWGTDHMHYH